MGNYILTSDGELYHYGVKGQKWGVRRYQNKDGSLTAAGKRRIKEDGTFKTNKEYRKEISDERSALRSKYNKKYGVVEAYDKADEAILARARKMGYDPADTDPEFVKKVYDKADALSQKSAKAVDAEMRSKYGKDYDNFVNREQNIGGAMVVGGVTLSCLAMYGMYKVPQLAVKGVCKLGKKAVKKFMG